MDQNVQVPIAPQASKSKLITIILICIVLLGVILYFFSNIFVSKDIQFENTITELPAGEMPANMPQDIVLAEDSTIISNYMATTPSGKIQSTFIYKTQLTLNDLASRYTDHFIKNGWSFSDKFFSDIYTNDLETPPSGNMAITVVKDELLLQISFSNEEGVGTLVSINTINDN